MDDYGVNEMLLLVKISLDDAIRSLNNTSTRQVRGSVLRHLTKSKKYLSKLKELLKQEN